MFSGFAQDTLSVINAAMRRARQRDSHETCTNDLLGALLELGGGAPELLAELGIDTDQLHAAIDSPLLVDAASSVHPPARESAASAESPVAIEPPFSLNAIRALEFAVREALILRQSAIKPPHLLLGLLRADGGSARELIWAAFAKATPPDPDPEDAHELRSIQAPAQLDPPIRNRIIRRMMAR